MTFTLQRKVAFLTAGVVVAASAVSTVLVVSNQQRHIEQQLTARGVALAEALARSAADGLAREDLTDIRAAESVVAVEDVTFAQILSTVWLGVDAVPIDRLTTPPDPAAVEYFASHGGISESRILRTGHRIEVYHAIAYDPHDARIRPIVLGYVRLQMSTTGVDALTARTIRISVLVSAALTFVAVAVLTLFIGRYVVNPIVRLRAAVGRHREGEFPHEVTVEGHDEVGALSAEFNRMTAALREREGTLAEEKERLAVTLRSIGDAVIVTGLDGRVTLFNRVAEQLTGWSGGAAIGRHLTEVMPLLDERTRERLNNPLQSVLESGAPAGFTAPAVLVRPDGTEVVVEDSAAPVRDRASNLIGAVIVFRDVTEKRRLEQELLKAERLQSLGVLAGGLAHDFNNLLTAVLGHVSMAKLELGPSNEAHQWLVDAEAAAHRATGLTRQLLTFAKGGAPVRRTASVAAILRESASLTLSGRNVTSTLRAAEDVWPADVDEGQISQVFNNLLLNAVQAMPAGGNVSLGIENVTLPENALPGLLGGPCLKITVNDTGVGIPPAHLARVFDPYFTTKQLGSGLGLSSVYSIVSRHGGHIDVASTPGIGTTFTIHLPAAPGAAIPKPSPGPLVSAGRAHVLVMDDEEAVRKVVGSILGRMGYEVGYAADGREAIDACERARSAGRPFDVVIMDLTIPGGMGGLETIARLREADPSVSAIVSSGYSTDPVMADYAAHGFAGVITKPYTADALSLAVEAALRRPGAAV